MTSWQKLKPLRDIGIVLVALFVPFFVLRSNIKEQKQWNDFDRVVVMATAPFSLIGATLGGGLSNWWSDYIYLVDVKADNARLALENARLRDRVRRLEQQEVENRRLKKLLGLRDSLKGDIVSAQVIGKDVTEFFRIQRLALNKGARDVRKEMPVFSLDGVVGVVSKVADDKVDVKMVIDADSAVDVVVERTGARGIVRGTGDPNRFALRVQYAERVDDIEIGDLMVTSGVGRRFPKGIPVARVAKVIKREFGIYQEVEATPTVDFSRLDEVLIMTTTPNDETPSPKQR